MMLGNQKDTLMDLIKCLNFLTHTGFDKDISEQKVFLSVKY